MPSTLARALAVRIAVAAVAAFVLSVAWSGAFAQGVTGPLVIYAPGGGAVTGGAIVNSGGDFGRLLQGAAKLGDVSVIDTAKVRVGTAAADTAMGLSRNVPWGAVARGAARIVPVVGTAVTAYQLWDAVRCKSEGGASSCDPGADEQDQRVYTCGPVQTVIKSGSSPMDACGQVASALTASPLNEDWVVTTCQSGNSGQCFGTRKPRPAGTPADVSYPFNSAMGKVCPPRFDGQPSTKGADGKCSTGVYEPATEDQVKDKIEQHGDKSKAADVLRDILAHSLPGMDFAPDVDNAPGTLSGPSTVNGPTTTTTTRDAQGNPTGTTTKRKDFDVTYDGNRYEVEERDTTVNPDGSTTETNAPAEVNVETCGLPGKPPCKIDETGTATGQGALDGATASRDAAFDQRKDAIEGAGSKHDLPWMWGGPSIPSGACSVFSAALPGGRTIAIDFCSNPWVLILRQLLAWALAIYTAIYCWRTVNEVTRA